MTVLPILDACVFTLAMYGILLDLPYTLLVMLGVAAVI